MFQDELVERRVVSLCYHCEHLPLRKCPRLIEQPEEGSAAVCEVRQPMLDFGWAKRVHIKANILAVFAVAVALEGADLVEGDSNVRAAKRFVLVELEAVLVVQVQRPKL